MMTEPKALDRLATLAGIEPYYHDIWGHRQQLSPHSTRALLAAMGFEVETESACTASLAALETSSWQRVLEPVSIVSAFHGGDAAVSFNHAADLVDARVSWTITEENGTEHGGATRPNQLPLVDRSVHEGRVMERRRLNLPAGLPLGYHRLELAVEGPRGSSQGTASLVTAPSRCYLPEALAQPPGLWGFSLQLYGLAGRRSWGMGDFGDLRRFVGAAGALGAGAVGFNPTSALFLGNPAHASPYSPSARAFLNPLYLDIDAIPEFDACEPARERLADPAFGSELASLRHHRQVDYIRVTALKLPVLEMLYSVFLETEVKRGSGRAAAFRLFQRHRGETLESFAAFEALAERFRAGRSGHLSWRDWPVDYRDPGSAAVAQFRRDHVDRLGFFEYLQWEADRQVALAAAEAAEHGMQVGLYRDLALGSDRHGADAWLGQQSLALTVSMGAPPDPFNMKGQNWGLPPSNPIRLREAAYRPFIEVLRSNMRHAGALRIDHILGFMRLFWIPEGASAAEGGYVRYPLADLLAITALESERARCAVVGEDLGTVPEGLRERLHEASILSCRLLYFEHDGDGAFRSPDQYPALSHVAIGSHDLPTFSGFWRARDIDLRVRLGLFPTAEMEQAAREERVRLRRALIATLRAAGLWSEAGDEALSIAATTKLVEAVHAFLARTEGRLLMVHPEDLLGVEDQANQPGTVDEHPNWRRKLPVDSEDLAADPRVIAVAQVLRSLRPPPAPA